jgi:carbonyl reductase 1
VDKGEHMVILNNTFGGYSFSKVMLIGLTRIQQREFDRDRSKDDIVINSCCPGYVATDLNNHSGILTTAQGFI